MMRRAFAGARRTPRIATPQRVEKTSRMTNRREVLQIGIAVVSVWPLASRAARATSVASPVGRSALPLYKVIYDLRFPHSVSFARRAEELGAAVHAIEGDMTRVWYDDIHHRWKQGAAAIAGLTAHGAMFCFEQLAKDQGMRAVFRAQHSAASSGRVAHELCGPVTLLDDVGAVGGPDWAARMAELVMRCPSGRSEIVSAASRSEAGAGARLGGDSLHSRTLYSWVLAPAVRV
jgi:hypothetical protein